MTPDVLRLQFSVAATAFGALAYALLVRRDDELRWWPRLTGIVWAAGALLTLAVYTLAPGLVRFSDAVRFYFPQVLAVLAGQVPYRDFPTSYSPLFQVLLAPAVWAWRSPGAIVLTMQVATAIVAGLLVSQGRRRHDPRTGWRAAFLVVASPISLYWIGVGGYNSVLIAMFGVLALVLADRDRPALAGVAGALAMLGCKLLGVLIWPAVVFVTTRHRWRRAAPLLTVVVLLGLLHWLGWDVMMPITREHGSWTGGNVWMVLCAVWPAVFRSPWVDTVSAVGLFLALLAALWRLRTGRSSLGSSPDPFQVGMGLTLWLMATFMIVSKKSHAMYLPMLLPFAAWVHVVVGRGRPRALWPLFLLSAVMTLEAKPTWLAEMVASRHFTQTLQGGVILAATLVRLICLGAMARAGWSVLSPGAVARR